MILIQYFVMPHTAQDHQYQNVLTIPNREFETFNFSCSAVYAINWRRAMKIDDVIGTKSH